MSQLQRTIAKSVFVSLLMLSLCGIAFLTKASAQEAPRDSGSLIKPPTIKPPTARSQSSNSARVKVSKRRARSKRRTRRRSTTTPPATIHTTKNAPVVKGVVYGTREIVPANETELPPPTTSPKPKGPVSGGVLNGRAISLPLPPYPPIARAAHASGTVVVQVVVNEDGTVTEVHAVSGHPLLQRAAEDAARNAKFSPTRLRGQPVKVTGVITYNFVSQ